MSQQEVYNFLKKNKSKWFNNSQIIEFVNCEMASLSRSTKKLSESGIIMKKDVVEQTKQGKRHIYYYKIK